MNFDDFKHHPVLEDITDYLCKRTQNTDRNFFRVEVLYFLSTMATCMRANIVTKDRGTTLPNTYAVALSPSGTGKGFSIEILESEFLGKFKDRYTKSTFPSIANTSLEHLAAVRALRNSSDDADELERLYRDYNSLGEYVFAFDSGTVPAIKQLRQKLLLATTGSINYMVDEIGSNLLNSSDLLTAYLELYDQGKIKEKLTKNTSDNKRLEEIEGRTPSNMLLFGTPSKLMDASTSEKLFIEFLETGYARRCLFAWGKPGSKAYTKMTAQESFDALVQYQTGGLATKYANDFEKLADSLNHNKNIQVPEEVSVKLIEYKFYCEQLADQLPEHSELKRIELSHRHSKALKAAGTFAFVDGTPFVSMDHLEAAIKLVEESGEAFAEFLSQEPYYAKLAKYIADVGVEVTHADLVEALPFYKSGVSQRKETMALAVAWGYRNHIIIKKNFIDSIEFFSGSRLKENDLQNCILSYSDHFSEGYENARGHFSDLVDLVTSPGLHFTNHHVKDGYRNNANVIDGFNTLIFDIDGTTTIQCVQEILSDYQYLIYTTKSHTAEENRFRLIMPINYELELDSNDYKATLNSVMDWLPFEVDEVSNQRARKWRTNDQANVFTNDGQLLDILKFIPRTTKNEEYLKERSELHDLGSLEKWFAERMAEGNRNNNLLKYGLALADSGMQLHEVSARVHSFNKSLQYPIPEDEIDNTILVTVSKRYIQPEEEDSE